MWGNISGVVGKALENVKKIQNELENQMDQAVGATEAEKNAKNAENNVKNSVSDSNVDNIDSLPLTEKDNGLYAHKNGGSSSSLKVKTPKKIMKKPKEPIRNDPSDNLNPSGTIRNVDIVESSISETNLDRSCSLISLDEPSQSVLTSISNKSSASQLTNLVVEENNLVIDNSLDIRFAETQLTNLVVEENNLVIDNSLDIRFAEKEKNEERVEEKHHELINAVQYKTEEKLLISDESHNNSSTVDLTEMTLKIKSECESRTKELLSAQEEKHKRNLKDNADHYEQKLLAINKALEKMSSEVKEKDTVIRNKTTENESLLSDMKKTKEALVERERALETATRSLSETHKLYQDSMQKISDLKTEIMEKDVRNRQIQNSTADMEELRKQLHQSQETVREQAKSLEGYIMEGQKLSSKQGELEKLMRKCKTDLAGKDAEILKLKASKDQLVKAIEETQNVLKKHEDDANSASKSLSAMHAVSQASSDKLSKLEAELTTKSEEAASLRRALDSAWAECTELKRVIAELNADRGDLCRQIGEGTSKVMETESSRRDIEQREAVLRATSKQLQDSLQRQMHESAQREEMLRKEVNEMRGRWQEAVGSKESMASEISSATSPLLREISSLQELLSTRRVQWLQLETSLTERALLAENAAETAEHKRATMEEQLRTIKQQFTSTTARLNESLSRAETAETAAERLRKREASWLEEKNEVDSRYALEVAQRQSLQSSLRELEIRHKLELQDQQERLSLQTTQRELEYNRIARELQTLKDELSNNSNHSSHSAISGYVNIVSSSSNNLTSYQDIGSNGNSAVGSKTPLRKNGSTYHTNGSSNGFSNGSHNEVSSSASSSDDHSSESFQSPSSSSLLLADGEVSFVATEKHQQRTRRRDDEISAYNMQIHQLQASRNALLEEVSYLSMRNSQLEEQCASVPTLKFELQAVTKRLELLLVLLGEKEEELEAMMSDMKEMKNMYRNHIEELMTIQQSSNSCITSNGSSTYNT